MQPQRMLPRDVITATDLAPTIRFLRETYGYALAPPIDGRGARRDRIAVRGRALLVVRCAARLIASARLHRLDPEAYLRDVIHVLAALAARPLPELCRWPRRYRDRTGPSRQSRRCRRRSSRPRAERIPVVTHSGCHRCQPAGRRGSCSGYCRSRRSPRSYRREGARRGGHEDSVMRTARRGLLTRRDEPSSAFTLCAATCCLSAG